jgi:phenylalanyl-tRNA synthetase beta chain
MNYSFLSQDLLDTFGADDAARRVALPNPVSSDYAVMRDSLVPQMVDSLGRNLSRQVLDAGFFEIGKVFLKNDKGSIVEEDRLCIGLMGKVGREYLDARRAVDPDEMFLWLKGLVQALCVSQHLDGVELARIEKPSLESGWAVSVSLGGIPCGAMGLLAAPIRRKWRMAEPVAVAELSLRPVVARMFRVPQARVAPAYPSITRDVAMIVKQDVTHEDVLKIIWKSAPPELTEVKLFDIFTGKAVGAARKSLAYSLIYRSLERTLTDEDANRYHEAIKKSLKSDLGADIRES